MGVRREEILLAVVAPNPVSRFVNHVLRYLTFEPYQVVRTHEVSLRSLLDDVKSPFRIGSPQVVQLLDGQSLWHRLIPLVTGDRSSLVARSLRDLAAAASWHNHMPL